MSNHKTSGLQSLANLGWQPFFQQQLSLDEWDKVIPARIIAQHKSIIQIQTESSIINLDLNNNMPEIVVGDWILLDEDNQFCRLLERKTCFKRKSSGTKVDYQLISANVDVAFIVCSMNDDFNLNRIERYLALVNETGAEPIIVLTKKDLTDSADDYINQVRAIDDLLAVEAVNSLDSGEVAKLTDWIKPGNTIAVLGSSGVGKSTLVNSLSGSSLQSTAGIREDDSKGRHTTTSRSLIEIPSGGLILDTPGMREIQLADAQQGIDSTFSDITQLAQNCRFSDCSHTSEPGCAVLSAVENEELDLRRLQNYQKLIKEEAFNSASLSEKRAKDKALGKFYKKTLNDAYKLKGR